ncbi:hypothetical protein D3C83_67470 [compost metagenome]
MMIMVTRKVFLRPTMSPTRPNTSAPNGRTRKPAANAARVRMKPVVGFTFEKKWWLMLVASDP